MSEIKIFVTHTPNSNQVCVKTPFLYHVIAGSDFQTEPVPEGMLRDNEGKNISFKNRSYCELTTQYWAWKNQSADYYGFCHYRRFFSFFPGKLREADCGCLIYPYFDENLQSKLRMDEQAMRQHIEEYDVLIAKGIPVNALRSKSVYQHYQNASELHIEDLELLLDIIKERYPQLFSTAQRYVHGKIFYPCNMFIMKRGLFEQYSEILFHVLEEFEIRKDMKCYSREGIRTPGHLGERMAGIFYEYLKEKGKFHLGELQMVQIEQTDVEPICNVCEDRKKVSIPVVLAANQDYVPILYTCLRSILDCASFDRQYEIYIFHTNIGSEGQKQIRGMQCQNIKIIFVNVAKNIGGYCLKAKGHITSETYYRFLILDIMKKYSKVVYLDCDVIVQRDLAELYDVQMGDKLIGAVLDPDFIGQYNGANPDTRQYCDEVLKLKEPYAYFQAGVLLFNVNEWNHTVTVGQLFQMSETGIYKYSDQDILNIVCEGRVLHLDMGWNMLTDCNHSRWHQVIKFAPFYIMDEYERSREHPYIIHYAGAVKPWQNPKEDFAGEFWKVARTTPYYEEIIYSMCGQKKRERNVAAAFVDVLRKFAKKILPQGSWMRRTIGAVYWKLK